MARPHGAFSDVANTGVDANGIQWGLDPIEPNSMSLLSVTSSHRSGSGVVTPTQEDSLLGRPHIESVLGRNVEEIPDIGATGRAAHGNWQVDSSEFVFRSNSTPSKKSHKSGLGYQTRHMMQSKRRRSQLIGAKPRISSKLNPRAGAGLLEFVDDQRLTPIQSVEVPNGKGKRGNYSATDTSDEDLINFNGKRESSPLLANSNGYATKKMRHINVADYGRSNLEKRISKTPIISIEDHISLAETSTGSSCSRKISLADIRDRSNAMSSIHNKSGNGDPISESSFIRSRINPNLNPNQTNSHEFAFFEDSISDTPLLPLKDTFGDILPIKGIYDISEKVSVNEGSMLRSSNSTAKSCAICNAILSDGSKLLLFKSKVDNREIHPLMCKSCATKYELAAKYFTSSEIEKSLAEIDDISCSMELNESQGEELENASNIFLRKRISVQTNVSPNMPTLRKVNHGASTDLPLHESDDYNLALKNWFIDASTKIKTNYLSEGSTLQISSRDQVMHYRPKYHQD